MQVRQQEDAKELTHKVAKAKKRIAEMDVLIKKLYETYAIGRMEGKRFELLSAGYKKEQDKIATGHYRRLNEPRPVSRGHGPRR